MGEFKRITVLIFVLFVAGILGSSQIALADDKGDCKALVAEWGKECVDACNRLGERLKVKKDDPFITACIEAPCSNFVIYQESSKYCEDWKPE